jgi:integrase
MPREARGPYLRFDKDRGTWTIIDGKHNKRTGFGKADRPKADGALKDYLGAKHTVAASPAPCIADVLAFYGATQAPTTADGGYIIGCRIGSLLGWWGAEGRSELKDVTTENCREYVKHRELMNLNKAAETEIRLARRDRREPDIEAAEMDAPAGTAGAREDLTTLRAAINYWHKEKKPLTFTPTVSLPDKSEARDQWMTRSQIAAFLWRSRRIVHNIEPNPKKRPRLVRYLARFIILGFYTGSRSGVVLGTTYKMADFANDFMKRKPYGARRTKKRAPMHKLPKRLKFWLKLWQRVDKGISEYVVHLNGNKVTKLRRSWNTTRELCGLSDDITPHTLRHSRATHLMKNKKVDKADAAEYLGMTLQTFLDTYAHHDPEWQKDAADAR